MTLRITKIVNSFENWTQISIQKSLDNYGSFPIATAETLGNIYVVLYLKSIQILNTERQESW